MILSKKILFVLTTVIISFCSCNLVKAHLNDTEPTLAASKNTTQQAVPHYPSAINHTVLHEKHLQTFSILYAMAQVANQSLVSEVCNQNLRNFQQNILHKRTWAMKVLDASGSKPAGFMFQNNFWLGSSQACAAAHAPPHLTLAKFIKRSMQPDLLDDVAPFELAYQMVYIKHNSPWQLELVFPVPQILHLGLCLPASCSTADTQRLMHELIQQKLQFVSEFYDFRPEVLYVKDLKLKDAFFQRTSLKILTVLMIFTAAMMLSAAYLKAKKSKTLENKSVEHLDQSLNGHKNVIIVDTGMRKTVKNCIECFDISTNCQKLFDTKPSISDDIPVINGLRSIFAIMVLGAHVIFFVRYKTQNIPLLMSVLESESLQKVSLPKYLVDGFFAISGFLQIHNFLKNTKQMDEIRQNTLIQNVQKFLKLLFHRYLRIAPLFLVTMVVTDILTAYINDVSVFHIIERYDVLCPKTWWHNVLFIQSFLSHKDLCLYWSWSLSCEMQYFFVATILLFIYVKHPKFVKSSALVLLASNIVWSLYRGTSSKFQFAYESAYLSVDEVYISSLVRATPYILGAITAWYFIEKQRVLSIGAAVEKFLWNFTIVLLIAIIYSGSWRDVSYLASSSLLLLGHVMISLVTCWLIIASATGRGTRWTRILEAPAFQHINRLTYAIYLLNPFIITFLTSLNESSTLLDEPVVLIYIFGFSLLVYLASIVFSLAFEMPYCNLSSLVQKRNKTKTA